MLPISRYDGRTYTEAPARAFHMIPVVPFSSGCLGTLCVPIWSFKWENANVHRHLSGSSEIHSLWFPGLERGGGGFRGEKKKFFFFFGCLVVFLVCGLGVWRVF